MLAHSWETKKRDFVLRHSSNKLPVIRVNADEKKQEVSEKQNLEQRLSSRTGTRHNKKDKSLSGESKLVRRQSGDEKQAYVYSKLGSSEPTLTSCIPLTVKDISRILSTDKNSPMIVNEVQCNSPSTPKHNYHSNTFHTSIKETATRNEVSSPRPPRPPIQYVQRVHRTRSLDPSELNKSSGEDMLMPSSPGVQHRKRSSTWRTRHSEPNTGPRSEQSDSTSRNSHNVVKVCTINF